MIIDFFKALAAKYNDEQKCGFCWEFGAPLSESAMNNQQAIEGRQCCVNLFVADYKISSIYSVNNTTGLTTTEDCDHRFIVYVGQQREDIGQNVYNEIEGHDITSSLWAEVYKPLMDCLGCDRVLYECELGFDFRVTAWDMETVKFKEDRNFTGWKITGRFRVPNLNNYRPSENLRK
jgi:hypothetical protein